jgi:hypothetical protein
MAPAARPAGGAPSSQGLVRASVPQIRPITAKKATIVGMQPAATSEQRQAAAGAPAKPAAPAAPPPEKHVPSMTPPDGMKTIARPSPAFLQNMARKGGPVPAAAPSPTPGSPRVASAPPGGTLPRPSPGLPSKLAAPRTASSAVGTASAPKASPPAVAAPPQSSRTNLPAQAAPKPVAAPAPPAASSNGKAAPPLDDIEVDLGDSNAQNRTFDLGDDGLADAEAALEAMQSFRLAEAALQRNDLPAAEKLAQKAVDGDPTQTDYLSLLAWIKSLGNDPAVIEQAIATMSSVLGDDPSSERALLYRGKLLARTGRANAALADLNELLAANPQHREALAEVRQLKGK